MPFLQGDAEDRLRNAGFTGYEINEFSNSYAKNGVPINHNIDSATWQSMIDERRNWVKNLRANNWNSDQIAKEINGYYARKVGASPYDFLKAEYRPSGNKNYAFNHRTSKMQSIASNISGYYGGEIEIPPTSMEEEPQESDESEENEDDENDKLFDDMMYEDWMPDEDEFLLM
jgi:hypothetical protein